MPRPSGHMENTDMNKMLAVSLLTLPILSSVSRAGSAVDQFNALGYGTLSGRLQTLSMYRDFDAGNNNYSTKAKCH